LPIDPSRSRNLSRRFAGASSSFTGRCAASSLRTSATRARSSGERRESTGFSNSTAISRMAASFSGCWSGRGTTLDSVLQLSIRFAYSGCRARSPITSQNSSASGQESSSARTDAVDVPSDVPARS